jgi:hypothetical protein
MRTEDIRRMTTLNIRNVEEGTARLLKSEAALRGMTLAQLLEWLAVAPSAEVIEALKAERDAFDDDAKVLDAQLVEAREANLALRAKAEVAVLLLCRLQEWDHMQPPTADGPFWLAEIAKVVGERTPGVGAEQHARDALASAASTPVLP